MPRNGQGVYSLPPVYEAVTGETIEAQQHNVPLEDIASDLNNARPISTGGTGGQSATQARENLDVYSKAESIQAIGEIAAKETPVDADSVVIVDSEDGNKPKKSKVNALVNTMRVGAAMAGANSKETLDDGDFLGGVLADGSTAFKTPWGKIKAALLGLFVKKSGDTLTGQLMGMNASTAEDSSASFVADSAGGAYVSVPKRRVPFKAQTTTIGNSYAPVLNVTYNTSAWAGVWSQGVINNGNNAQPTSYQIIHMHTDGSAQKFWTFDGVNGEFSANGSIRAGGACFYTDGNLSGSRWAEWGNVYAFDAINAQIEKRANDYGNDRGYAHAIQQVRDLCYAGRLSLMRIRPGMQFNPNDVINGADLAYASLTVGGSNNDRVTIQSTFSADGAWRLLGHTNVNPYPQGNYGNLVLCAKVI
ncbi:hypothetical protein [Brucella sp. 458]|uniref:hypothetical protein n=1 Tax=Brucella sp. 458 TaxID=2821140 RepID=UPI001FFD20CE|nr:hypothetical protein [Brucella sp. 458]